jgi:hypothetical protein
LSVETDQSPLLALYESGGNGGAQLAVRPDGTQRLAFMKNNRPLGTFGLSAGGWPALTLFDKDGQDRLSLGLLESSRPSLTLLDDRARVRAALGGVPTKGVRPGEVAQQSEASLRLLHLDSKVVWETP